MFSILLLSNKNINAIALQYKNTSLKTDPGSKFLSVIPAFASFGMVTSINLPLYLQMETIMMPMVNAQLFVKAFTKKKHLIDFWKTEHLNGSPGCTAILSEIL